MKKQTQKQPRLVSARELASLKAEPTAWVVDGLLRTGRKRMSLLAGKPESGKSSLALQLAVSVCKGEPFLGRATKRSQVLYWMTEEDLQDIADSLRSLDYDHERDAALWVYDGSTDPSPLKRLHDSLAANPEIRLVVLETLDDVLKIQNVKENSAAREAFEKFDKFVMTPFSHQTAFLALHHLRKRELDNAGDMILGATVLRGKTDAKWYLRQVSDEDTRRIFHATTRKGRGIPPTYVEFDERTGRSTLGMTVAESRKLTAGATQDRIQEDVLAFFQANPNSTLEDCLPAISGNSDEVRRVFKNLVRDGRLVRSGKGRRGDPYIYSCVSIPVEGQTTQERLAA